MKHIVLAALLAVAASACTIDARDNDDEASEGAARSPDAGTPSDGDHAGTPSDPLATVVTYVAPSDFTGVPTLRSNAGGGWEAAGTVEGRTVTWSVRLDAARLTWQPCLATTVGSRCGYTFNVDLPGYVPGFAVTQDGAGALRELGTLTVSGAACVRAKPVDNGLRGGNYWLHACP